MTNSAPKWKLRNAEVSDVDALALIGSATFLETFAGVLDGDAIIAHCKREHSSEAYMRYLESGGRAWLAETVTGSAPVGFALTGTPDLPCASEGDVELKRIYLLSRFHGTGLGAALLDAVLAAHNSCKRLVLGVYAKNDRAISFYRKQGFEQIAIRRFDVGGTQYDDQVLARPMASGSEQT